MQKYPNNKTPYRYEKSSNIRTCCRSRLGQIKKLFPTEKAARKKASQYEGNYDVYPCRQGSGYHIRKHREGRRK